MRTIILVPTLSLALGTAILQACSTSTNGTGPNNDASADQSAETDVGGDGQGVVADAEFTPDAGKDAEGVDARPDALDAGGDALPCTGVRCNGACLPETDCRSCSGASLLCAPRGECVANCAGCAGTGDAALPIECYACDENRQNPVGTCQPSDATSYCLSGSYVGNYPDSGVAFHCPCADAGTSLCPGSTQVCAPSPGGNDLCVTCGEVYVSDLTGLPCKNGSSCNPAANACQSGLDGGSL